MEKQFDKVNMSLDDIIRASRLHNSDAHNGNGTFAHNERCRSRSRSRSRSCSAYRGQQWRLERGQQQHVIDNPRSRSRSRSRSPASYRSSSQIPSLHSVSSTPSRCRSLPCQTNSFCNKKPASVQHMGWRSGFGVNIRKHSLGLSASRTSVFRQTSSLHQLRLAKKRVEVAKSILNARHKSYLRQLRQYRHEILEDSFQMPLYRLKNMQEFPGLFSGIGYRNKISHPHLGWQQVHTTSYPEGTLSVTIKNDLANSQSCTHTVEGGTTCFKSSEALTASPQTIINGSITQNPSVGKVTSNDGVCMPTDGHVRQTVATNSTGSLPVLVSSSDCPRLIYKPDGCNMNKKRAIRPANTVQTLNQRFSNYRVVCL